MTGFSFINVSNNVSANFPRRLLTVFSSLTKSKMAARSYYHAFDNDLPKAEDNFGLSKKLGEILKHYIACEINGCPIPLDECKKILITNNTCNFSLSVSIKTLGLILTELEALTKREALKKSKALKKLLKKLKTPQTIAEFKKLQQNMMLRKSPHSEQLETLHDLDLVSESQALEQLELLTASKELHELLEESESCLLEDISNKLKAIDKNYVIYKEIYDFLSKIIQNDSLLRYFVPHAKNPQSILCQYLNAPIIFTYDLNKDDLAGTTSITLALLNKLDLWSKEQPSYTTSWKHLLKGKIMIYIIDKTKKTSNT